LTVNGVEILELTSMKRVHSLPLACDRVNCVAYSPDGSLIAAAGSNVLRPGNGQVKIWNTDRMAERSSFKLHFPTVHGLAFSPDGTRLAAAGAIGDSAGGIAVLDVTTGQEAVSLAGRDLPTITIAFTPDGKRLVSAGFGQHAVLWDLESGRQAATLRSGSQINCLRVSPDRKTVAGGCEDGVIRLWKIPE
jgi:WD40 repeat protein